MTDTGSIHLNVDSQRSSVITIRPSRDDEDAKNIYVDIQYTDIKKADTSINNADVSVKSADMGINIIDANVKNITIGVCAGVLIAKVSVLTLNNIIYIMTKSKPVHPGFEGDHDGNYSQMFSARFTKYIAIGCGLIMFATATLHR
jgi:hypothetical protein